MKKKYIVKYIDENGKKRSKRFDTLESAWFLGQAYAQADGTEYVTTYIVKYISLFNIEIPIMWTHITYAY